MTRIFIIMMLLLLCTVPTHAIDVQLCWDANKETDLAGYKMFRNTTTSSFKLTETLGKVTCYTFSNVTAGKRQYYAVTAYNTAGQESSFSNLVRVYLMTAPANLKYSIITGNLIIQ